MPAAVGAGSFWTGMVDWIAANGANTDEVLQAIDDSWPQVGSRRSPGSAPRRWRSPALSHTV